MRIQSTTAPIVSESVAGSAVPISLSTERWV